MIFSRILNQRGFFGCNTITYVLLMWCYIDCKKTIFDLQLQWPSMTSNDLKWPQITLSMYVSRATHIFKKFATLLSALRHHIHINQCKRWMYMSQIVINELIFWLWMTLSIQLQWPEMTLKGLFFNFRSLFLPEIIIGYKSHAFHI